MKLSEAIEEVKKIAKRSDYEGNLTDSALKECAEVYLDSCDSEGTPKPRVYMRSGEGHKTTHLSEMQWLIVRTPSFRSWFGKSVVVDENGDPKVMYHGTWRSFTEFKHSSIKLSKVAMTLWSGPGFYFTDSEKTAKIYAGGTNDNIYDVFLRLENPLIVDETGSSENGAGISKKDAERIFLDGDNSQWLDSGIANELVRMDVEDGVKGRGKQYYKSMSRQQRIILYVSRLKTDVVKLKTAALAYGSKSQKKLLDSICRHTGHDGVIHTISPDVKEWVVYDPKAIKSANNNNGDFSTAKAKVEDSVDSVDFNKRQNLEEKGNSDMAFKSLIDTLTKFVGNPADVHETGMDIVDRNGRHHEPKGIPPGGQFEEEGKYLHGQAKIDHAIREAGRGKHATLLREHVAPLYAKMGYDSQTRAKLQAMHEDIRGLSKHALLRGMARHLGDMKKHADAYNEIKDMGKAEFAEWLQAHPEYNTEMTAKLMNESRYNRHYDVKGGYHDDGTGKQKHEAWEEAKWNVGAKAMASMILFQEHSDALAGAPDAIMANMIERASREEPQVENRAEAAPTEQITANSIPNNLDFEGAARQFAEHNHTTFSPSHADELKNFVEKAQRGELDMSQAGGGTRSNDMQFYDDIKTALGENHPITQALTSAVMEQRRHMPDERPAEGLQNVRESNLMSEEVEGEPRDAAEMFATHVDSQAGAGAPQAFNEHGTNLFLRDMPADVQEWAQSDEIGSFVSSDGNQYRRDTVGGVITQHGPISSASNTQNNANVGSNANTYTDRDGNVHQIEHNEGGLKAPIHQSEVGAVQAEMAKAFADAGNGVDGAEEYAHALSHFLGRGQDERSPHPGMRQEGLLKHQLADKMQARLDEKVAALNSAQEVLNANANDQTREAFENALRDKEATVKAVKTIAEKCGITPEMLPDGTNFNRVRTAMGAPIRAENPEHQDVVNALHAMANPESVREENATPQNETTSTSTQNATVGDPTSAMTRTFGHYLSNSEENSGEHDTPETIVNMLNGGAADDEIRAIREGYNNPGGTLEANPELADHLEAIRRLPREQQLAHVQRLMGVEPTENAQTAQQQQNLESNEENVSLEDMPYTARIWARNHNVGSLNSDDGYVYTRNEVDGPITRRRIESNGQQNTTTQTQTAQNNDIQTDNRSLSDRVFAEAGMTARRPEQWRDFIANLNSQESASIEQNIDFLTSGRLNHLFQDEGLRNEMIAAMRSELDRRQGENVQQNNQNTQNAQESNVTAQNNADIPSAAQIHDLAQQIANAAGGNASASVIEEAITDIANGRTNSRVENHGLSNEELLQLYGSHYGVSDNPTFQALMNHARNQQTNVNQGERTETQEPASAQAQFDDNHVTTFANEMERLARADNPDTNIRSDAVAETVRRALENPNNEYSPYASALLGEDPSNRFPSITRVVRQLSNTPAMQAIQAEIRRRRGGQTQNISTNAQNTANANASLNRTVGANGGVTYSLGNRSIDDIRNRRGQAYEWNFRRNQTPTVDQLTPEMIKNVVYNLPTGYHSLWRNGRIADVALEILENPSTATYGSATRLLERLSSSNNKHAKRYMQILNAMHPDFEQRRQREEQERLESQRREEDRRRQEYVRANLDNTISTASNLQDIAEGSPNRVNFTAEDANDAIERIVQSVGDVGQANRQRIETMMHEFQRTGNVPESARGRLQGMLPSNHPVMRAITEAELRTANEHERKQIIARTFQPTIDSEVKENNKRLAESNGLQFRDTALGRAARESGYNCYLTALVYSMRRAGIDIPTVNSRPSGYGAESQKYFLPIKQAMANAGWKPVQGATREETINNLNELARTKPNGYTIELWSDGHHGTHAYLLDGEWVFSDVFNGDMNNFMSSEQLAGHIANVGPNGNSEMSDNQKRLMKIAILRGLTLEQRRSMTSEQKEAYINEQLRKGSYIAESSFGHDPNQGFTDELIKEVLRR